MTFPASLLFEAASRPDPLTLDKFAVYAPSKGRGLQTPLHGTAVSGGATMIATRLHSAEARVADACELVAEHFFGLDEVDGVVLALTLVPPGTDEGWMNLGDRAWLREWSDMPEKPFCVPNGDNKPEHALTTPWISAEGRAGRTVVIADASKLGEEAAQDRLELGLCGAGALGCVSMMRDNQMYGSLSIMRRAAGPWTARTVADLQLLTKTLSAMLAHEHQQRLLIDAVQVGEQARAIQQQFFATIGHELRTPVSTIIGHAELLADEAQQQGEQPDTTFATVVEKDAGVVLSSAEHLLAIVEDLLETGRSLGEGTDRVDIDVAEAVADVLHWHKATAQQTGVSVASVVDPDIKVRARTAGFRQVLSNLIGNAIIHNRHGDHVEIAAQQLVGEGGQPRVRVTVRDTGRGLSAVQLRSAFEPFVRFAQTGVHGTGLGLPLSRTVAERDGGEVGAQSTPGQGSVFWVDLPAA